MEIEKAGWKPAPREKGEGLHVDVVVAEIGSTTTLVSAFDGLNSSNPRFIGQGEHFTTVKEGDVTVGIDRALKQLEKKLGEKITWEAFLAASSAAGGLRVTVHGLVYDMTVRAAKEAALGAGAIIKYITTGKLNLQNFETIYQLNPNMVLLAGGVDHGETETVLHNAHLFSQSTVSCPIVYAGNCEAIEQVQKIFAQEQKPIFITENVYPKVDELNVLPVRKVMQELFSKHIIHAKGMEKIEQIVKFPIIPTPAAVMNTAMLLSEQFEDVIVADIGGATTDVDSVTHGNPDLLEYLASAEPFSKRTVEGDLGVFINAKNVAELMGKDLTRQFANAEFLVSQINPYPQNAEMENFTAALAKYCFIHGLRRHAGRIRFLYGPLGRKKLIEGKDLTAVKAIFGTGGVLSRSKAAIDILSSVKNLSKLYPNELLPPSGVRIFRDKDYLFACIGILSTFDLESAKRLLFACIEEIL